jgi:transcriptional regulator with XRE-family HTH domain
MLKGLAEEHRKLLTEAMGAYEISISEVARVAQVSRAQLSQYLGGLAGNPTCSTLDRLHKTVHSIHMKRKQAHRRRTKLAKRRASREGLMKR